MEMMKRIIPGLVLVLVLSGVPVKAADEKNSIILFGDAGSFNRGYNDHRYREKPRVSFPVFLSTTGLEYQHTDSRGYRLGCGMATASINDGKRYNFDHYVYQPLVTIMMPSAFIGRDFGFWALDIGISWCFTLEDTGERMYLDPSGAEVRADEGGMVLDRRNSFTFFNFLFRILPEDSLHVKVGMGREDFHPVDSLLYCSLVFPRNLERFEMRISFPTGTDYIPSSNQTVSIRYAHVFAPFTIGFRIGILAEELRGNAGSISLFNRMSTGITLGLSF